MEDHLVDPPLPKVKRPISELLCRTPVPGRVGTGRCSQALVSKPASGGSPKKDIVAGPLLQDGQCLVDCSHIVVRPVGGAVLDRLAVVEDGRWGCRVGKDNTDILRVLESERDILALPEVTVQALPAGELVDPKAAIKPVVSATAIKQVGTIASKQSVIARGSSQHVVTCITDQQVVSSHADKLVAMAAADQLVMSRSPDQGDRTEGKVGGIHANSNI